MKSHRILLTVAVSCLLLCGCNKTKAKPKSGSSEISSTENEDIRRIYALYQASGGTLSYEEWLETIKGEKGDPGQNGRDGNDGATILSGSGAPSSSLGKTGDYYIDTLTWNFYKKGTSSWSLLGNLKGAEGKPGNTGQTGPQGNPGTNGKDGTSVRTGNGAPSSSFGNNGDSYINLQNWDYYVKESGTWVLKGNIKGDNGQPGSAGVSIISTTINQNGDLIVEFSNGESTNAGHVVDTDVYTVRFHVDDEIITTRNVIKGNTVERPTEEETAGYTITDWYFLDGEIHESWKFFGYVITEDIDLYADFTYNNYELTLIDETFGHETQVIGVTYDKPFTYPSVVQDGYTLQKWQTSDGEEVSDLTVYRHASNLTLYAVWVANGYTVTLNPNGGSVSPTNLSVTYNQNYSLPIPEKTGYTFIGWYDGDIKVSNNATWKFTTDKTFTAQWTNVPMTFTLDAGDGECSINTIKILYGEEYTLPEAELNDHYCDGWLLNDVLIPLSGTWTYTTTAGILYAHYCSYGEPNVSSDHKTVKYGLYPKMAVTSQEVIDKLNKVEQSKNGYYLLNSYYYQKVTAVRNGETLNDGTTIKFNEIYWVKCAPILWRILKEDSDSYLLLSDVVVDGHKFGTTYTSNNYATSEIRRWLNDEFFDEAFSAGSSDILTTEVDNSAETTRDNPNTQSCENTFDKVFLLSYQDYCNESYGFVNNSEATDKRTGFATDYAILRDTTSFYYSFINTEYTKISSYLTRSPRTDNNEYVCSVNYDGRILNHQAYKGGRTTGVRPAIRISK